MKFKNAVFNIIYITLIYIGVVSLNFAVSIFKKNLYMPYSYFPTLLSILMGILLSLEYLIKECKKSGHWSVDINKLIFIVIPLLFFTFSINIYFSNIVPSLSLLLVDINYSFHSYLIFGVFLGYNLATSFFKKN